MSPWNNQKKITRHTVRDFRRTNLGNPLFASRSRNARHTAPFSRPRIGIIFAIIFTLFVAGIVLYSPLFQIATITIQHVKKDGLISPRGEEMIHNAIQESIQGNAFYIFPRKHIFILREKRVRDIISKQVALEEVHVRKKLPKEIVIEASEKEIFAVFIGHGRLFGVDREGVLIREVNDKDALALGELPSEFGVVSSAFVNTESISVPESLALPQNEEKAQKHLPIIVQQFPPDEEEYPGITVTNAETIALVLTVQNDIKSFATSARYFTINNNEDTIEAVLKDGWKILFLSTSPIDIQMSRLAFLLREKLRGQEKNIEYIDLRHEERIFYRLKK